MLSAKRLFKKILSVLIYPFIYHYIKRCRIKELIMKDAFRYKEEGVVTDINRITVCELFLNRDLCFRDIFYFRCHQRCFLLKIFFKNYPSLYIDNGVDAEGGAFYFHHPFSTYINATYVGYGCTFRNNTTIGNKNRQGQLVAPKLCGKNDIGVHSCIIGGISIGEGSIVGAGSVVVKDVPAYSVVAGNPASIIKHICVKE